VKTASKSEILELVSGFHGGGQKWHYHLLTPNCQFNKSGQFAIFVEHLDAKQIIVNYADVAEMELSKALAGMLHGAEVMDQDNAKPDYASNKEVFAILKLIRELTDAGIKWHHHVFFPGCTFNTHGNKHELVCEDPRNGTCLISISDDEPKEDLKQIEAQFYNQQ
jgi:hypothetical protein